MPLERIGGPVAVIHPDVSADRRTPIAAHVHHERMHPRHPLVVERAATTHLNYIAHDFPFFRIRRNASRRAAPFPTCCGNFPALSKPCSFVHA
jgi:hypothetical protein